MFDRSQYGKKFCEITQSDNRELSPRIGFNARWDDSKNLYVKNAGFGGGGIRLRARICSYQASIKTPKSSNVGCGLANRLERAASGVLSVGYVPNGKENAYKRSLLRPHEL
uniref:Uncharacterized protein n=1 Tax=Anopheles culicifacies TaxID=139723 RepID=A0A182MRD2_9DIPT